MQTTTTAAGPESGTRQARSNSRFTPTKNEQPVLLDFAKFKIPEERGPRIGKAAELGFRPDFIPAGFMAEDGPVQGSYRLADSILDGNKVVGALYAPCSQGWPELIIAL